MTIADRSSSHCVAACVAISDIRMRVSWVGCESNCFSALMPALNVRSSVRSSRPHASVRSERAVGRDGWSCVDSTVHMSISGRWSESRVIHTAQLFTRHSHAVAGVDDDADVECVAVGVCDAAAAVGC